MKNNKEFLIEIYEKSIKIVDEYYKKSTRPEYRFTSGDISNISIIKNGFIEISMDYYSPSCGDYYYYYDYITIDCDDFNLEVDEIVSNLLKVDEEKLRIESEKLRIENEAKEKKNKELEEKRIKDNEARDLAEYVRLSKKFKNEKI